MTALFIIGTVAFVLSALVMDGIVTGSAGLARVAANPDRVAVGALLVLVAGFALAMVPVVFWPVGRRYSETLAMGYVVFRGALEALLNIVIALGWLVLVALSSQPDAAPLAALVRTTGTVMGAQLLSIPFALGALMFYLLLFRSRLVPRWLAGWGLVGAVLYLVAPLASMFGRSFDGFMAPLAVQEMVMAAWLIARAFDPTAMAAASVGEASRRQKVAASTVTAA